MSDQPGAPAPTWRAAAWWVGVGVAAVAVWAVLTWPFLIRLGDLWQWAGDQRSAGQHAFTVRDGAVHSADHLQNVFIDSVIVDNLRELREPYLDLREGSDGPKPLRTTSLNLPWTPVVALLWPLVGLVPAYNATLLLSSVATALAAFGFLRRHTRWPLLAAAGALVYAASPHRMFQLTVHFNAVMWWAFPAAAWAFEAMVERWRHARAARLASTPGPAAPPAGSHPAGNLSAGRWGRSAAALAAVVLIVGVSGEYHLALFMAGLVTFLAVWVVIAAAVRREPVPWAPVGIAVASVAVACAYVLFAFWYVFRGRVEGGNGDWDEVLLYSESPIALVQKTFGEGGEGMIYVGWVVVALAAVGFVAALRGTGWTRRRDRGDQPAGGLAARALPYAILAPPVLFFTFGPTLGYETFQPYQQLVERVPFLSFQRVPQRLMIVTALILVLLGVVAADRVAEPLTRPLRPAPRWWHLTRSDALRVGAAIAVVVTLLVLADYRVSRNLVYPSQAGNAVVERLAADGDGSGPVLGLPAPSRTSNFNAATTYVAALSRRRTLNAYNQTPAPWLDERMATVAPLTHGEVTEASLAVLRETGTRQVVVIDEAHLYREGEWRSVVDSLTRSGHFRLVVDDPPMALLERTG